MITVQKISLDDISFLTFYTIREGYRPDQVSVQLYNTNGDMVAVGNLSTPLKKNFSSEATIKVKLTY